MIEPGFVATELQGHNTHPMVVDAIEKMREEIGEPLEAEDIAEAILYAVGGPERVAVNEVLVRPGRATALGRCRRVTFQAPGEVRVDERPEPELLAPDDAIVRVEATGVCGSDLHIYHGRVKIEPGLHHRPRVRRRGDRGRRRGHEGRRGRSRARLLPARRADLLLLHARASYHKCDESRVFGHGATLGSLQGAQAEQVLVPRANLTLRRVPEGMSDDAALFAGDVMGTGYHAVVAAGLEPGDTVAVLGLGPVGLCAVQARARVGAARVIGVDTVPDRLAVARSFGAEPVHLTEEDPRAAVKAATEGRGADVVVEAVGHPDALDWRCRMARKAGTVSVVGVYAERCEVHMGVVWIKALKLITGHANVIAHVDRGARA